MTPKPIHNGQCICFKHGSNERQFLVLFPTIDTDRVELPYYIWESVTWATISAYELNTSQLAQLFVSELKKARFEGVRIAFDAGDPPFVRKNIEYIKSVLDIGIEVLQLSEESMSELADLLQMNINEDDMTELMCLANIIILTRGKKGLTIFHNEETYVPEISSVQARDTTGARDIVLGSFLWAIDKGYSLESSIKLGLLPAYEVVKVVGPHRLPRRDRR